MTDEELQAFLKTITSTNDEKALESIFQQANINYYHDVNRIVSYLYNNDLLMQLKYFRYKNGDNITHWMTADGNLEILKWLAKSEDPQLKGLLTQEDNDGDNITHWAAIDGNLEILKWLAETNDPELKGLLQKKIIMATTLHIMR